MYEYIYIRTYMYIGLVMVLLALFALNSSLSHIHTHVCVYIRVCIYLYRAGDGITGVIWIERVVVAEYVFSGYSSCNIGTTSPSVCRNHAAHQCAGVRGRRYSTRYR